MRWLSIFLCACMCLLSIDVTYAAPKEQPILEPGEYEDIDNYVEGSNTKSVLTIKSTDLPSVVVASLLADDAVDMPNKAININGCYVSEAVCTKSNHRLLCIAHENAMPWNEFKEGDSRIRAFTLEVSKDYIKLSGFTEAFREYYCAQNGSEPFGKFRRKR